MGDNYSFKTKWIDSEERFAASLLCNGEVIETHNFDSHGEMMIWISGTMASMLLCGEEWNFKISQ